MAKEKNILDPQVIIPKIKQAKKWIWETVAKRKKLFLGVVIILLIIVSINMIRGRKAKTNANTPKIITAQVDRSFEFPALDNQGRPTKSKIKFKITNAEKTNQVTVKDQIFTAKNNKMFLIVNLELKNDATQAYNILPGDLIRLTYNNDEENKFAPDLHNNLVPVAAISTKIDRVGFVISQETREFKLYLGELEGKKEIISVNFPS